MGKKTLGILVCVFLLAPALVLAQGSGAALGQRYNMNGTAVMHTPQVRVNMHGNATSTRASLISGTVASVSGNSIMLTGSKGASYSVDATNAKLVRRFGAAMQLSDIQTGDVLLVTGVVNGTSVAAKTIRDQSLQAHNGTFNGTVSAVNGSGFTLQSKQRGNQTINTTSSTVFKKGTASSSLSDIAVGQTVTVSGVWDRTNSNVTASRVTIKVGPISITGTLGSISGNILSVTTASSTTYSVDATNARIVYKGGRKGSLSILQTGDSLNVYGKTVSGSTSIMATLVRDSSRTFSATSTPQ
jgi:Domain of unknown function (DUF5666)